MRIVSDAWAASRVDGAPHDFVTQLTHNDAFGFGSHAACFCPHVREYVCVCVFN